MRQKTATGRGAATRGTASAGPIPGMIDAKHDCGAARTRSRAGTSRLRSLRRALLVLVILATGTVAAAVSPGMASASTSDPTAYVTNSSGTTVTPIDTATQTPGTPITVGNDPVAVAITRTAPRPTSSTMTTPALP
jgi:DNA-binding beta-propeller fold protein YncE